MGHTKIDMLIKELCRETGEPDLRNYDSFVGHIRRGYSQLNIAAVQIVKYAYIELNSYNAIDWPCDCLKALMIGLNRNGCLITLSLDDKLLPSGKFTTAGNVTEAEAEIALIASGAYVPGYSFDVNSNGELYGLGAGYQSAGFVTHDPHARQSHIKGSYLDNDTFMLVYLADGISDGLECVPIETENALRAFALSEYFRIKNPGLSQVERQKYKEEVTFLRKFYQSRTADDWADAFSHNEKSSPK